MSLPSGYTRLEYIESTGAQYIDTGFKPNNNTRVVMDITPVSVDGTHLFGSRSSNAASDYFLFLCTGGHYRDDYAADKLVTTIAPSGHVVIDKNKSSITIGGTTFTHTTASFTGAYPIYLLASNTGGSTAYFTKAKLYSCRIYSNGTIVRDFIPCKNASGAVGMWDDANSRFYANAGSGAFTAGPVYVGTHKTLVNGTVYEVKGGKCLVNGTAYSIKKGRTLIGGTGYDITFASPVNIYGVEWDWTNGGETRGVRTDKAANFPEPNPAINNGTGSSPFDDLYPWCDMVRENRAGGVEVKEPKYWFKWTKTGRKIKLQIADGYVEGFSVDPVNRDRGDGLGELDYSYIGRYHCASGYKSTTGAAQQVNIKRSQARSGIHNLGANFWQMDFAQFWYVNMLFLVEFADWNGERIGRGCSTSDFKMNNGQTDAMSYHTGTTAANRDSYGFTQYRNIEGWWDNVFDWMDGCYNDNNGLNVISNPKNFSDTANGTLVGKPTSGYSSDFTIPTANGLEWALFPSASRGSPTTYVPDNWNFNGRYTCLCHGGNYNQQQDRGPFCIICNYASVTSGNIGCRLQERPPKR